jgi:type VI secretion system protein ImpE
MPASTECELALRDGNLQLAMKLLQDQIRGSPADPKLRVFLFQLLCVQGAWERALNQLAVAGELDGTAMPMVETYREAVRCEMLRNEVFLGKRTPLLLGEPAVWVAMLVEALSLEGKGRTDEANAMRDEAFAAAPTSAGMIDGRPFQWVADADMRLGPVLEAVINGKYYWVPMGHLARIAIDPPADLRDCVWAAAHLNFINGGESVALLPIRYAGTDLARPELALARRTEWLETRPGFYTGVGQRLLTSDTGDSALLDVRVMAFDASQVQAPASAA